jgi:hypothetical protein
VATPHRSPQRRFPGRQVPVAVTSSGALEREQGALDLAHRREQRDRARVVGLEDLVVGEVLGATQRLVGVELPLEGGHRPVGGHER